MLYQLAHVVKNHFGWLWEIVEGMNSLAFKIRYRTEIQNLSSVISRYEGMRIANESDADALEEFFSRQPEGNFEFFKPHDFDASYLKKLLRRTSFQMFVVEQEGQIVGYFFLRSFVHGVCYLGKMVDDNCQGRGIGKMMCKAAMDVASSIGLQMLESINTRNIASLRSTAAVLKQRVIKVLEHGDLLILDTPIEVLAS